MSRYHVNGQRLPRFEPKQNPFRATTRPESVRGAAVPGRAATAPARTAEPKPVEELASQDQKDQRNQPGGKAKGAVWLRRWAAKVSSWFQARSAKPAKPTSPRFRPPVQGELSLVRIRVVRNDLSDSDLEVVPAGASPKNSDADILSSAASSTASKSGGALKPVRDKGKDKVDSGQASPQAAAGEPAAAPPSLTRPRLFAAGGTLT